MRILSILRQILVGDGRIDSVTEGVWAHQHPQTLWPKIRSDYQQRWAQPEPTPQTHPWLFDPCDPPKGWIYDPYYEFWIKLKD